VHDRQDSRIGQLTGSVEVGGGRDRQNPKENTYNPVDLGHPALVSPLFTAPSPIDASGWSLAAS
jgi:hypothetical protein